LPNPNYSASSPGNDPASTHSVLTIKMETENSAPNLAELPHYISWLIFEQLIVAEMNSCTVPAVRIGCRRDLAINRPLSVRAHVEKREKHRTTSRRAGALPASKVVVKTHTSLLGSKCSHQ